MLSLKNKNIKNVFKNIIFLGKIFRNHWVTAE
jgi:hypothetical protein